MSRSRDRADRIRAEVPLDALLEELGYAVTAGGEREQQFSCDLHGDGSDSKPSARYYPESNSWYCFACGRARDAIATVMEKQGMGFSDACKTLEAKYDLPPLPWKDDIKQKPKAEPVIITEDESDNLASLVAVVKQMIDSFTRDGAYDMDTSLKMWEAYDRVLYMQREQLISEVSAIGSLERIKSKAMDAASPT